MVWVSIGACGRTPLPRPPYVLVQVVDERDHPLSGADVAMRDQAGHTLDQARADGDGVATFEHPGPGTYRFDATTDLTCCLHDGTATAPLGAGTELVVVTAATGPCPTASPPSCR